MNIVNQHPIATMITLPGHLLVSYIVMLSFLIANACAAQPVDEICNPSWDGRLMPNLVGCPLERAVGILKQYDDRPPEMIAVESNYPVNQVFRQSPGDGTIYNPDEAITLYVSTGPRNPPQEAKPEAPETHVGSRQRASDAVLGEVVDALIQHIGARTRKPRLMPDLRKRRYEEALRILAEQKLPKPSSASGWSDLAAGLVYEQRPAPGTNIRGVSEVQLFISRGLRRIPDLKGRTKADAAMLLARSDFRLGDVQPGFSSYPEGQIYDQTPTPGPAPPGRDDVMVYVSQGPATRVPSLVGMKEGAALEVLRQADLVGVREQKKRHSPRPANEILHTAPKAGTLVVRRSQVTYGIASGLNRIPQTIGLSIDAATVTLTDAGFRLGEVTDQHDDNVTDGVLTSAPEAGQLTPVGSPIALVMATHLVELPNLTGEWVDTAEATLTQAGFKPVMRRQFALAMPGRVLEQSPTGRAKRGDAVTLMVAGPMALILAIAAPLLGAGVTLWPPTLRSSLRIPTVSLPSTRDVEAPFVALELHLRVELVPGAPPEPFSVPIVKEV